MSVWLKQSTAVTEGIGPFIDAAGAVQTGLTISQADVRLKKNGAADAQKNSATSCTHDVGGVYDCPLDVTDTNTLGRLQLIVNESPALPVVMDFMVVSANVWDSMFGADKLQVDIVSIEDVAATPLRRSMSTIKVVTVASGSTTTVINTNLTETTNDHYNGRVVVFCTGALAEQAGIITDYDGTTKALTVSALTEAPSNTDILVIV